MKVCIALACVVLWSCGASQGALRRVNLLPGAIQSAGGVGGDTAISANGRFVAFYTGADDLVPGDTNGFPDVFVVDQVTGIIERVSVSSAGIQGNEQSLYPSISADGRFVGFTSNASNLVVGDTNGHWDIFVHDRLLGLTTRVSVVSGGGQTDSWSIDHKISADGRFVHFLTRATNMGYGNFSVQANVHDRVTGQTTLVSNPDHKGVFWYVNTGGPSINADGRYVTFTTLAELVANDTNDKRDIYLRDLNSGTVELISVSNDGSLADGDSEQSFVSADGRFVAFRSYATNLIEGDTNGTSDIFLRDRQLGETTRISVSSDGVQGSGHCTWPRLSADGDVVVFSSSSSNLVPLDQNGRWDVFLRIRSQSQTLLVSKSTGGVQGEQPSGGSSITADGKIVSFSSGSSTLVPEDSNGQGDVFIRNLDTQVSEPTAFQLFRGNATTGNLQSLLASDDDRLVAVPGPVFTSSEFPIQILVDFTSVIPNPSRIEIYNESHASSAAVVHGLDLFNFTTNSYVQLRLVPSVTVDRLISGVISDSAAQFVGPNGLIRARVRYKAQGPVFSYPWQGRVDHMYGAIWP